MKKRMHVVFGLGLLLTAGGAPVYAAPSTNFWDDMESEEHFDAPVANIGTWSGGEVRDTFLDIIPDNPFSPGDERALLISRDVTWPAVGLATEQAVLTAPVHFEFDMYVVGQGAGMFADFLMLNQDFPGGGPVAGTSPHIRVRDSGSYPTLELHSMWNDNPDWHIDPIAGAPTVMADTWYHYELDYVIGDVNSMFIAVDGGTQANIPAPWGEGAYGDPASDPNARSVLDEITGLMFRPAGVSTVSQYYVDNVLLVIDNPPLKVAPATVVATEDTSAFNFETLVGIRYGLASTADLVAGPWVTVAGWTVLGTGGTVYVFDPNPLGPDTEKHYRIVVP